MRGNDEKNEKQKKFIEREAKSEGTIVPSRPGFKNHFPPNFIEFLLVKNCPWTKLKIFDLDSTQNYESESDLVFCPGTFFDQKEFKRNLAGTGS
jgi:hypothetical protein